MKKLFLGLDTDGGICLPDGKMDAYVEYCFNGMGASLNDVTLNVGNVTLYNKFIEQYRSKDHNFLLVISDDLNRG